MRQALIDALGSSAPAEGSEASYPSLIDAMAPEIRAEARARLDALDRESLSAEALTDLSRVYVLLGAHKPAAQAGLALQRRDPKGTQGLVLAAAAKLEAKDYPSSAALAKQALEIDPNDLGAKSVLQTAKGRGVPTESKNGPALNVAKEPSKSAEVVDNRPLRPAGKTIPGQEPPAPIKNEPGSPSSGGLPWLPYVLGGTLVVYGAGRSIKHALERGRGALEQTAEKADAGMGDLYFKGKDFVQEHPYATLSVLGGAVLIGGWLLLPALGIGVGGGGLMLATAGGGNVAAAATASGVGVGAMKVTAVAAVAAAPLLMNGDGSASKTAATEKQSGDEHSPDINEDQWLRIKRVLKNIREGNKLDFPKKDGTVYRNAGPGKLPHNSDPGYYREYTVPKIQGIRGEERLVLGKGGEVYFSPDHYYTFISLP